MSQILEPEQIILNGKATTPAEAIDESGRLLVAAGAVTDDYLGYMHDREASVSTYMGNFLAIPHGSNEGKETILDSALSFVRYETPIDWKGNPVRFAVGIAGKEGGHLEILSKIALVFSDEDEVQKLIDATSKDEIMAILGDVNE